ncbi:hypothetical protein [Fodinibius sp. Rm-B-1B1-1]|uniref:hypothetical protein n=1 Tax=Fodinibius alkaliphilus TaxID=3140241 RepID=UPI00315A38D2
MKRESPLKKSVKVTLVTLVIYGLLVATHLGEFWPFSIYPMFSKAGNPWKRAIVQDITHTHVDSLWKTTDKSGLPGQTVALNPLNVNTNDIANYLSKTEVWTQKKQSGVRKLLKKRLDNSTLLVYQARGSLTENDKPKVEFIPYLYFTADTTLLNNNLRVK